MFLRRRFLLSNDLLHTLAHGPSRGDTGVESVLDGLAVHCSEVGRPPYGRHDPDEGRGQVPAVPPVLLGLVVPREQVVIHQPVGLRQDEHKHCISWVPGIIGGLLVSWMTDFI